MKAIYKGYAGKEVKPFSEWNSEVQDAVKKALELVEGKKGFKTPFETWKNCELIITIGHNIYTTSVEIRPIHKAMLNRKKVYWNGYAYFYEGSFFGNFMSIKVELI